MRDSSKPPYCSASSTPLSVKKTEILLKGIFVCQVIPLSFSRGQQAPIVRRTQVLGSSFRSTVGALGRAWGFQSTTAGGQPSPSQRQNIIDCSLPHFAINMNENMNGGRPKAAFIGLRLTCPWRAAEGRHCR